MNTRNLREVTVGLLIGALLFAALGLFALGAGLRNVYRALASRGWPTVSGIVTGSTTEQSTTRDGRKTSTSYSAKTLVQYRVGERAFTTGSRHFGQFAGSGDASDAVLERMRYPVGATVKVAYNPGDPALATMRPGLRSGALVLPFIGLCFMAMGALLLSMGRAGGTGLVLTVFSCIFCGIGVALLIPGSMNLWYAQASAAWPTTKALVVYGTRPSSEQPPPTDSVIAEAATEAPVVNDSLEESNADHRLVYRYEVDGVHRFGNVRQFGQLAGSSDGEWSSSIAARYPLGKTVTVSYSLSDSERSVLEPGISQEAFYLPGAGLAFLLFGLAALVFAVPALSR